MVQWKGIQLGTMRLRVRSLALLSGLRIRRCYELWCRSQTQLRSCVFLWLWCRPAAVAPIRSLAWKPPYAAGVAQEIAKKDQKKMFFEYMEGYKVKS